MENSIRRRKLTMRGKVIHACKYKGGAEQIQLKSSYGGGWRELVKEKGGKGSK